MGCCASDIKSDFQNKSNLQNNSNLRVIKIQNKIPKRQIPDL